MKRKIYSILALLGVVYVSAQDVSVIRNTVGVYSDGASNGSARYLAMAGSMGALGGETSLIGTNPAGVAVNIVGDVSMTLSTSVNKNKSSLFGTSLESVSRGSKFSQAGGVFVFRNEDYDWKSVNLGINYANKSIDNEVNTPKDLDIQMPYNNGVTKDQLHYYGHRYNTEGDVSKLSIALGGNYKDQLYIGGAVNFHSLETTQDDITQIAFENQQKYYSFYKQNTPFSERSKGISVTAGVIGKVQDFLRLGLNFDSGTWWNIDRDYISYLPGTSYSESRKLTTPMKLTLSGAVLSGKDFVLNVDYSLGLAKPKYVESGESTKQLNEFISALYDKTSEIKIGAEYRIDRLRLRGGYAYSANPLKKSELTVIDSNHSVVTKSFDNLYFSGKKTFSLGIGYDFSSFYLDAAFQSRKMEYSNPFFGGDLASTTLNTGISNDRSIVSNVNNTNYDILLTLGWKF